MNKKKVKGPENPFAMRLKGIRKKLKLKQDDFCKKVKISATQLSKIENGKNKPGHDFYYNLVKEFDVNLNYLLFGEGPMFRYSEKAGGEDSTFPLDKFRHEYSRVNEEIDEFLFYFFKSDYFRFKIMAEAIRIRNESNEFINNEINRKEPSEKK
ncbi:MAG: helix-turn-helix domain-containing protein [Candidatus Aminicenantes bacterium]|nr:helix-turn-helix domain-containing protein [Candidatus Aminicenantes bacterium]